MYNILIIDPVLPIVNRIKKSSRMLEADFFVADNEYQAVNIFLENKNKIDLIILDVSMHNLDGFRILKKIRDISPDVKILILTSLNRKEYFVTCLKLGVDDYILKPFDDIFLQSRIKMSLPMLEQETSESEISLRKYYNKHYSLTLEQNKKMIFSVFLCYKSFEEGEIQILDNDMIPEAIYSFLENRLPQEKIIVPFQDKLVIGIIPEIDVMKVKSIFSELDDALPYNDYNLVYTQKILPDASNQIVTYQVLARKLKHKLVRNIKYNLKNVRNLNELTEE